MQVKQMPPSQPVIFCVHSPSLPSEYSHVWPSFVQVATGSCAVPVGASLPFVGDWHAVIATTRHMARKQLIAAQ